MPFTNYQVVTKADLARGTGLSVSLQKMGRGKQPAQLVLSLRPEVAEQLGWKDKTKLEVALGEGEHHGLLRLRKSSEGSATLTHRTTGDGRTRGGPYFRLSLGHVPLFPDRSEEKRWCIYDRVEDDWVEIVLPKWADETGPKAAQERPRPSAGTAATPPPAAPPARDLAPHLMGDPPRGRSALAMQREPTRGEARRAAERREAPQVAADEAASWNRKAASDAQLVKLIEVFGLTRQEARVVSVLLDGRMHTREGLIEAAWDKGGTDQEPDLKIIDVFVSKVRKKLSTRMVEISTVRAIGYKMEPPAIARVMMLIDDGGPSREDDEAQLAALSETGEE